MPFPSPTLYPSPSLFPGTSASNATPATVTPAAAAAVSSASITITTPVPGAITPQASAGLSAAAIRLAIQTPIVTQVAAAHSAAGNLIITFPNVGLAPSVRRSLRVVAGREITHPELGNGLLFTPTAGLTGVSGSFKYGEPGYAYDLTEAALDGGCLTNDWDLAAGLRASGFFTEVKT